jgi:DNA-binding MarR family transcriptional regulator
MDLPPDFVSTPALLRMAYNELSARIFAGVAGAGYDDLRPAHGNVMEHLSYADGLRLTDLAARAGMTAQSIGELVDDLERRGYVERRPDPVDRRAKRVHRTAKGTASVAVAGRAVREVEEELVRVLGEAGYRRLRRDLEAVDAAASRPAQPETRRGG